MRVGATEKLAQLVPRLDPEHIIDLNGIDACQAVFDAISPPGIAIDNTGDVSRGPIAAVAVNRRAKLTLDWSAPLRVDRSD
jgi:hypothetical protein